MFELGMRNVCFAFSICNNNNLVVKDSNRMIRIRLLYIFVFFAIFFFPVKSNVCIIGKTFLLFAGYARRNSLDQPEIRRRTASLSTPHRASDIQVDPDQAALLFRDARGVSIFDFT